MMSVPVPRSDSRDGGRPVRSADPVGNPRHDGLPRSVVVGSTGAPRPLRRHSADLETREVISLRRWGDMPTPFLRDTPSDPDAAQDLADRLQRKSSEVGPSQRRVRMRLLGRLGDLERSLQQIDAAVAHLEEALALARSLPDRHSANANRIRTPSNRTLLPGGSMPRQRPTSGGSSPNWTNRRPTRASRTSTWGSVSPNRADSTRQSRASKWRSGFGWQQATSSSSPPRSRHSKRRNTTSRDPASDRAERVSTPTRRIPPERAWRDLVEWAADVK